MSKNLNIAVFTGLSVSVVSGILYLLGYWATFHINIFEFITITEILTTSIYPLASLLISVLVILVIFALPLFDNTPKIFTVDNDSKRERIIEKRWEKGLKVAFPLILGISFAINGFISNENIWYYIGISIALAIGAVYASINVKPVSDLIANKELRFVILLLIFFFPLASISIGHNKAQSLALETDSFTYVCESQLKIKSRNTVTKFINNRKLKYIGKAGEYFFFYRPDGGIRLLRYMDFRDLTFNKQITLDNKKAIMTEECVQEKYKMLRLINPKIEHQPNED